MSKHTVTRDEQGDYNLTPAKHTPGPWACMDSSGDAAGSWVGPAHGWPICEPTVYYDDETQSANARLIAAAPDMLDLARNIAGLDEGYFQKAELTALRNLVWEWRDEARALIAKAEGRAS